MALNNLRIIYDNVANISTLTASTTSFGSTPVNNLKTDARSYIWRSGTSATQVAKANLIVVFPSAKIVGGVILPICNLSSTSTIRVRGYTGTAPTTTSDTNNPVITASGTLVFDTGTVNACPYTPLGNWSWGTQPLGINTYSYTGGTYARVWFPIVSCTSLAIEIVDPNSTSQYIEATKLIVGSYWSPKFNTTYGLSSSVVDSSTHSRSQAGSLVTNVGSKYNTLTFDLNWLTSSDRTDLMNVLKGSGMNRALFVSLFPDNTEDWSMEQAHQIYGKLSQINPISYATLGLYSSQIQLEEI
jgi:hypothetical protein